MLPKYEIRKSDLTVKRNDYELFCAEHIHKYIEIAYVYKGKQRIIIDGAERTLTEGSGAVIFPNIVHSYNGSREKDCEVLILMCAPKLFGSLFPDLQNSRPQSPFFDTEEVKPQLKFAFNALDPNAELYMNISWTCVIMSYILEMMKPQKHSPNPVENLTYEIIKYIEENFTDDITRTDLAKKFSVSECYISRIFSNNLRINLRNYLGFLRAEYAASLIRKSEMPFTEISIASGFNSIRTFNRIFKAAYGISPKEYKNNISRFLSGDKEI